MAPVFEHRLESGSKRNGSEISSADARSLHRRNFKCALRVTKFAVTPFRRSNERTRVIGSSMSDCRLVPRTRLLEAARGREEETREREREEEQVHKRRPTGRIGRRRALEAWRYEAARGVCEHSRLVKPCTVVTSRPPRRGILLICSVNVYTGG